MGRRAEGWKLRWRGGIAYVRFTHDGEPHSLSTGERDPAAAGRAAARIYAEVVSGAHRRQVGGPILASRTSLDDLSAQWVADLEATHDKRTAQEYEWICQRQWLTRWAYLSDITASALADYQRARLREVTRETTRKHLVALRTFLLWAKEQGALQALPEFPTMPARATGVRARDQQERRPFTPKEIERVIRALPIFGTKSPRHPQFRVREWAIVAWETALRPTTIAKLEAGVHYQKGDAFLRIRPEDDKARFARELPLSKRARKILDTILPDSGPIFGPHDYREHLEAAGRKAVGRPVLPYDLRHSRITSWLAEGKDAVGVQFIAGHRQFSTTAVYVHPTLERARKVVA